MNVAAVAEMLTRNLSLHRFVVVAPSKRPTVVGGKWLMIAREVSPRALRFQLVLRSIECAHRTSRGEHTSGREIDNLIRLFAAYAAVEHVHEVTQDRSTTKGLLQRANGHTHLFIECFSLCSG